MPKRAQNRYAGKRCTDYMPGCGCCDYWRFYDEIGRFPYTFDELHGWQITVGTLDANGSAIDAQADTK